jgi:type VI secretion system protein ImpK
MRLVDCFTDVLAYAKHFLQQPASDYQGFRSKLSQLIGEASAKGRQEGFSAEDCDAALFAVVAWLDEAILSSTWSEVGRWQKEPLQTAYFKTGRAGIEFFTRLEALPPQQRHVREVYFLCLLLGFKGRYVYQTDRDVLATAQQKHLTLLVNEPALLKLDEKSQLFPGAYPPGRPEEKPRLKKSWSLVTLNLVLTPVVVVLVLYGTYHVVLSRMVQDFSKLLTK